MYIQELKPQTRTAPAIMSGQGRTKGKHGGEQPPTRCHVHGGGGTVMVVGVFHSGAGGDHGDLKPNSRLFQASLPPPEAPPLPLPGGREEQTAGAAQEHRRKTTTSSQARSFLRSMAAIVVRPSLPAV